MAQLKVIGTDEQLLQECATFQLENKGILTENKSGEQIGFFPFRSVHRIVSTQSPHGEKTRRSQASDQPTSQSQSQAQDQKQTQNDPTSQSQSSDQTQNHTQNPDQE